MHADLDALLTVLYVLVDDLLPRGCRRRGRRPQISDSELICLAVAQVLLDCPDERRFLRLAKQRLGHLQPRTQTAAAAGSPASPRVPSAPAPAAPTRRARNTSTRSRRRRSACRTRPHLP